MRAPTVQPATGIPGRRTRRGVLGVAVAGTVFIALGAFWLSFTSLSDLARRCGMGADRAWVWPLLVDGVIVIATVSVVALTGSGQEPRPARYPWTLLLAGTGVSVLANASHAVVAADTRVPAVLAALVAAVPPVVLVATTHLTVQLTRRPVSADSTGTLSRPTMNLTQPDGTSQPATPDNAQSRLLASPIVPGQMVRKAFQLREQAGLTNRQIAARLGVHPSTVGRWFKTDPPPELSPSLSAGVANTATPSDATLHEASNERSTPT